MWHRPSDGKDGDLEAGPRLLYPMMLESPDLRWAFIRKIYVILTAQMALTVAVASVVVTVRPISHFFVSSGAGLGLYIFLLILPFIGILYEFCFNFWFFLLLYFLLRSSLRSGFYLNKKKIDFFVEFLQFYVLCITITSGIQ